MKEYSKGSHTTYHHRFPIVWITKYRYNVLRGALQRRVRDIIAQVAEEYGVHLVNGVVSSDHVHIFLKVPPTVSPAGVVKILKGVSAKILFETHPSLRESWKKGHLWSPSYYLGSVGHVSQDTVKKYIEAQKKRAVGRPPLINSSND